MTEIELFTAALRLPLPWKITEIHFETASYPKELRIKIGHDRGAQFEYEGQFYTAYDHQARVWRHLDFFEHVCYIEARVPRVKLEDGSVRLVEVPWAEPGSSFTLLFEKKAMQLVKDGLSKSKAGAQMRIDGRCIGRMINRAVSQALAEQDLEAVEDLALDEVSITKGHNYFTILTDRQAGKVVGIAEGKDHKAVDKALIDMEIRGADRSEVQTVTLDMSTAYIAACDRYFPDAERVFDRFHIMKKLNEAVDAVRKEDQKQFKELKKTKWLWLKNASKLSLAQRLKLQDLSASLPNIGKAYRLKEQFKQFMDTAYIWNDTYLLKMWMAMAHYSGLKSLQKFVKMLQKHWYGIETFFSLRATNAMAEAFNLKIQEIKRIARGFRNKNNFKLMIYFHLGKLDLGLTH